MINFICNTLFIHKLDTCFVRKYQRYHEKSSIKIRNLPKIPEPKCPAFITLKGKNWKNIMTKK